MEYIPIINPNIANLASFLGTILSIWILIKLSRNRKYYIAKQRHSTVISLCNKTLAIKSDKLRMTKDVKEDIKYIAQSSNKFYIGFWDFHFKNITKSLIEEASKSNGQLPTIKNQLAELQNKISSVEID